VPEPEEVPMNVETKPGSDSEVENLVAEDDNAGEGRGITEIPGTL